MQNLLLPVLSVHHAPEPIGHASGATMVHMVPISNSDGRSGFAQRLRQAATAYGYQSTGWALKLRA